MAPFLFLVRLSHFCHWMSHMQGQTLLCGYYCLNDSIYFYILLHLANTNFIVDVQKLSIFQIIGSQENNVQEGGQQKSCPQAPAFDVDPRGFGCINVLQLVPSIPDHHNYFVNEMRQPWSCGLGQVHYHCLQVSYWQVIFVQFMCLNCQ